MYIYIYFLLYHIIYGLDYNCTVSYKSVFMLEDAI